MSKRSVPLDINSQDAFGLEGYALFQTQKVQKIEQLKTQGHCNVNYLIQTDGSQYLLRKFKHKSDRKIEFKIQNLAHNKRVGAKALLLDKTKELMICGFIENFIR